MITLVSLSVADTPEVWQRVGFRATDGTVSVGSVTITFEPGTAPEAERSKGILGWTLAGPPSLPSTIDGLATTSVDARLPVRRTDANGSEHDNGVTSIDHLVVMTPDVERTVGVLEDLGLSCRRRRDGEAYGRPMRQAFFWLGGHDETAAAAQAEGVDGRVILEVVGPPQVEPGTETDAARFFGIAFTCRDLAIPARLLGDLVKAPVDAVQAGRQITTISSKAGASVPIALMSPHVA